MEYSNRFLEVVKEIADAVDQSQIEQMLDILVKVREDSGRLFILGVGGSAANCSHAVNDFRKIAGIEAYAPVDNVSELTARTNDEGWHTVFSGYLEVSRLSKRDALLIFSVGGGDRERNVSANLVEAIELAKARGASVMGVVGTPGGFTAKMADACVKIPTIEKNMVTPQAEAWQAMIWHLLVSSPRIMLNTNKWESIQASDRPGATKSL